MGRTGAAAGLILLVEDDENDVLFAQLAMEDAEVTTPVQVVQTGQEAINYLIGKGEYADRQRYPLPSLILLDLKLPNVSGLEVLKWLRQQSDLPPLPVIALTSSDDEEDIRRCYQHGVNAFVVKPFGVMERLALFKAIDAFWLGHNQVPHYNRPQVM